jgi:hypothetical protein
MIARRTDLVRDVVMTVMPAVMGVIRTSLVPQGDADPAVRALSFLPASMPTAEPPRPRGSTTSITSPSSCTRTSRSAILFAGRGPSRRGS